VNVAVEILQHNLVNVLFKKHFVLVLNEKVGEITIFDNKYCFYGKLVKLF